MVSTTDLDSMTTEERRLEVAHILASGRLRRVRTADDVCLRRAPRWPVNTRGVPIVWSSSTTAAVLNTNAIATAR